MVPATVDAVSSLVLLLSLWFSVVWRTSKGTVDCCP